MDRQAGTADRASPGRCSWLIATPAQRQAAQIDLAGRRQDPSACVLLAQLVYAIGRLHKHGWVFGDLSFKNAVFALDPPRMMLLDCDGAADLRDLGPQAGASTPCWDPPECPHRPPARSTGTCRTRSPTSTSSAWPSCAA